MPFVPISFREAKEPVDNRQLYLESPIKEKGRKEKPKVQRPKGKGKAKVQKRKKVRQGRSGKSSSQDIISGRMGIQY